MMTRPRLAQMVLAVAFTLGAALQATAQPRAIDTERSTVTIYAYKSGLFSAFAHNHEIRAPIARGFVSEAAPPSVAIAIRTADMEVLDPTLAPRRRQEVRTRMLGPGVLDAASYPEITFSSTSVEPAASGGWLVSGELTIRGRTRPVTVTTTSRDGRYQGAARIRQRDFGIEPISLGGGTVKVKDELTIAFDIAVK